MAYLGRQPIVGNYTVLDALTATATDTYALTKNSVAVFPQTPANCIVSLNGVIQAPYDSYTISGSNIVFASALTASDSIDFITVLGDVLNVGTVSDGTITTAKIADANVTTAKLASGVLPTNTPAFEAKMSADQTLSDDVLTKVQFDTERFDTDSCYDATTNYRFTPTTAGKYYVYSTVRINSSSNSTVGNIDLIIYKNGSSYSSSGINFSANYGNEHTPTVTNVIDFNGSSDYVEIYARNNATGGTLQVQADTFTSSATFGSYKIIE